MAYNAVIQESLNRLQQQRFFLPICVNTTKTQHSGRHNYRKVQAQNGQCAGIKQQRLPSQIKVFAGKSNLNAIKSM